MSPRRGGTGRRRAAAASPAGIALSFHGGARTVTGSRYLLEAGGERLLVDCGLFQGLKRLRQRNWRPPAFEPASVRWVVLTHAHIDHSGALPRLVRQGFRGDIFATPPTVELARFMLLDSAHIQMEDAEYLNRKKRTKHRPALPLYDTDDVARTLKLFRRRSYGRWRRLSDRLSFRLVNAGHLLGSAMVQVRIGPKDRATTVLFSGDVGPAGMPLAPDPAPPPPSDYLVVESTYGDRSHGRQDIEEQLEEIVREAVGRRGMLLIPSFAVGRAQQIIYLLRRLMSRRRVPRIPIWLDSPMALRATRVYRKYRDQLGARSLPDGGIVVGGPLRLVRTREESMALNDRKGPGIIISSSGMLSGGRILHHLKHHVSDPRTVVLLVGYQAEGTRGRALLEGAPTIRIHKRDIEVRAHVETLTGLSGHADVHGLLRWLADFPPPRRAFVTHGEESQALGLARRLEAERGFRAVVPGLGEAFALE